MIREITHAHYLGVLCSHCNERIPVPQMAVVLYEEVKHDEVSEAQDAKSPAFTVRCNACDEEGGQPNRKRRSDRLLRGLGDLLGSVASLKASFPMCWTGRRLGAC
jgi:hypothetical protein